MQLTAAFRFFSRKREGASSGDRQKNLGKACTPEIDRGTRLGTLNPTARSVGLSNTMLSRQPTIKAQPQVSLTFLVFAYGLCYIALKAICVIRVNLLSLLLNCSCISQYKKTYTYPI